jgi:hypothetical protein
MRHIHSRLAFQPVDVVLDHDAGQHLAVGDVGTFEVWFDLAVCDLERGHGQPADGDAGDQPVAVFRGEYQVGVLDPEISSAYRPLVQEGRALI